MKLYDCANCGINQVDSEDDYCEECKEKQCSSCGKVIIGEPFKEFKIMGKVYCCDVCWVKDEEEEE